MIGCLVSPDKLKLAFVTGIFPRMSETFVLSQIEHAVKHGFEVSIFASEAEKGTEVHPAVVEHNLLQHTHYYGRLGSWVEPSLFRRYVGALGSFLRSKGKASLLRSINPLRFGLGALSLRRWYLASAFADLGLHEFDVIHCQFGPYGVFCAQLKQLGIIRGRLLTSFHGYDMSQHLQKVGNHYYDNLFQVGDQFLPISDHWRSKLIKLGCPAEKITVHRMGINTHTYAFRGGQSDYIERVQIMSIGRLVEKKGIEFAIRAVAKARERCPVKYYVVGDGPLREELGALVDSLDLNQHVTFLGWQSQEQIRALMRRSNLLVAPSVTARDGDQEGIPMVLMEAMASGLPVVSTYHSGIPELVRDGHSGRLVPERDVEGLSEAIVELALDRHLRECMAAEGRKQVEEQFNLHRLNDRLVDIYRQASVVTV